MGPSSLAGPVVGPARVSGAVAGPAHISGSVAGPSAVTGSVAGPTYVDGGWDGAWGSGVWNGAAGWAGAGKFRPNFNTNFIYRTAHIWLIYTSILLLFLGYGHAAVLAGPAVHGAVLAGPVGPGAVISGPHSGAAAVSGPNAGSAVISGPSGTITTNGAGYGAGVHAGLAHRWAGHW